MFFAVFLFVGLAGECTVLDPDKGSYNVSIS